MYQCSGCSVLFRDPEKFTNQEKVEGTDYLTGPPKLKPKE
jgi:hypothetical protein